MNSNLSDISDTIKQLGDARRKFESSLDEHITDTVVVFFNEKKILLEVINHEIGFYRRIRIPETNVKSHWSSNYEGVLTLKDEGFNYHSVTSNYEGTFPIETIFITLEGRVEND